VRILCWLAVAAAGALVARPARAYPWMIRHEYQGCVPCHADPSGAGLLTAYGRSMADLVLRTRYGAPPTDEPPVYTRFLWGVPTPDWLLLGASFRGGVETQQLLGATPPASWVTHPLQMEADLKAQVTVDRFRVYGSIGYLHEKGVPTHLTTFAQDNLVSREHWVGVDLGEDRQFLLRAGRIDIPFGIRFNEHDLLLRAQFTTRTNINESQQHGVAFSYNGEKVRAELMGILGNYQLGPDAVRERGYAGYLEVSLAPWASAGASSMVTYAQTDYLTGASHPIRQLHGLFTRLVPVKPLVILAEADAIVTTIDKFDNGAGGMLGGTMPGVVGAVQLDVEPTQGLHVVLTGETMVQSNVPLGSPTAGVLQVFGGWYGLLWFFAPHADVRFDCITISQNGAVTLYFLPQAHLFF
jgi:hypothetical protein